MMDPHFYLCVPSPNWGNRGGAGAGNWGRVCTLGTGRLRNSWRSKTVHRFGRFASYKIFIVFERENSSEEATPEVSGGLVHLGWR